MNYQYARLPEKEWKRILRLEKQFAHDTGKPLVLIPYKPDVIETPVFSDLQSSGPAYNKKNIFQSIENLYGNITQWHI